MNYDSTTLPIKLFRLKKYIIAQKKMRIMRFELILTAWKAVYLPLIYIRKNRLYNRI